MAIDLSTLVTALAEAPLLTVSKAGLTSEGAGTWSSLWKASGWPLAGATPANLSGATGSQVCTRATQGAITGWSNPAGGDLSFLATLQAMSNTIGTLIIADRLWTVSGISGTSVAAQSVVNPSDIPARDANGATTGTDVEPWIEIYSAPGATGATWTLTGTDAAGNTNRTWTYTHPANAETVGQMAPCLPGGASPAATLGMQRLVSFTGSISTGTAGDIGVSLIRRVAQLTLPAANVGQVVDFAALSLPAIWDDSCLFPMWLNSSGTTGVILGNLSIAQMTP